jgi:guanosine-3',5'-bis(diphosphate) 3'-pyrophosphohydrolase
LESVANELEVEEVAPLRRACEVAAAAHQGQRRASGGPYITHPMAVAEILRGLHMDVSTLVAAILHNVVDDTPVTLAHISDDFGSEFSGLVDGVTKIDVIDDFYIEERDRSRYQKQLEALRRLLLAARRGRAGHFDKTCRSSSQHAHTQSSE